MTSVCFGAFVLAVVAAGVVYAEVTVDCGNGTVSLKWKENKVSDMDPRFFRLGDCLPNSVSFWPGGAWEVSYYVQLDDCCFRRMATPNQLIYMNELFSDVTDVTLPPSHSVVCTYERPAGWAPPLYSPVWSAYGYARMYSFMDIMKDDFSGPAESTTFPLGSFIPIRAGVLQQAHMPLLLLLDECVAATTPELDPSSQVYPIISNGGCLLDSKTGSSRFLSRVRSSEIQILMQAMRFTEKQDVYIHCKFVAWDPQSLDEGKKACYYSKELQRWELLDDPSQSALCSCCDSVCKHRKRRSLESVARGLTHEAVIGPLTIVGDVQKTLDHNASVESSLTA